MDKQLEQYLLDLLPPSQPWVTEMEKYAKQYQVPIIDRLSMNYLANLLQMIKPDHILEIGTAIGYSALRMYEAYPKAEIMTIERDSVRYEEAKANIEKYQPGAKIKVIHGDGRDILESLEKTGARFDFVFIDAAKAQYQTFFERSHPLVREEGVIVTDNVLFKGYVANPDNENKRYVKIANKINRFNQWLLAHPDYRTSILPIGDGLAISHKIGHTL